MTVLRTLQIMWGLWALLYVLSFVAFAVTPATGDSFVRGVNRLVPFFWLQFAALIAAIVGLYLARGLRAHFPTWWWLSRIPITFAVLQVVLVLGLFAYAAFVKPPPSGELPPTTAPAQPSSPVQP